MPSSSILYSLLLDRRHCCVGTGETRTAAHYFGEHPVAGNRWHAAETHERQNETTRAQVRLGRCGVYAHRCLRNNSTAESVDGDSNSASAGNEQLSLPRIQRSSSSSYVAKAAAVEGRRAGTCLQKVIVRASCTMIITAGASASSLVSVSSIHLRPIGDPIIELLAEVHRLILACQLPPPAAPGADQVDHRRRVVEQFKRQLFARHTGANRIKLELRKVTSPMRCRNMVELLCS